MPKPHMGGTDMEDANKWEESTDVSERDELLKLLEELSHEYILSSM